MTMHSVGELAGVQHFPKLVGTPAAYDVLAQTHSDPFFSCITI
jgi:hypothetical protein